MIKGKKTTSTQHSTKHVQTLPTYDSTGHSREHDDKERGRVFAGVDEVGVGFLGVVVPPHALGKPPPGRQHRHHNPQTIRPRPTGECGALWGGGGQGVPQYRCFWCRYSHTRTHSQYSAESVSIAFRLAYGNRQTDRHTHRILTLAVHAR